MGLFPGGKVPRIRRDGQREMLIGCPEIELHACGVADTTAVRTDDG